MEKAYMIAECVGNSIYEAHTIPYVYMKREWAEHQLKTLTESFENASLQTGKLITGLTYKIREVQIVSHGPK